MIRDQAQTSVSGDAGLKRASAIMLISMLSCLAVSQATQDNDLWLLLSSYEDIGITAKDLAFFLATHGFSARPEPSYVVVKLNDSREIYVTPNGAAPRLGDLWMSPPDTRSGPVQVISSDAIRINLTYRRTDNASFTKTITRYQIFPVTPLGMCYDGSQKLQESYESQGYGSVYMYDPSGFATQGHIWVAVEDKDHPDTWLAVDSYYGAMKDPEYYEAPYSFADFQYLDSINPKWKLA
jgi:hypothetical protein